MSFKALVYAYFIGGITFIPFLVAFIVFYTIYTSVPVNSSDPQHVIETNCSESLTPPGNANSEGSIVLPHRPSSPDSQELNDVPKQRRGWMRVRRTFEESTSDGSYVTLMKSFLDSRSKDPKRSRPKDMWYAILKGKVLYLYEDEAMTECEAAIELGGHDVSIFPEGLQDGELFARRNAICLKPKPSSHSHFESVTKDMTLGPMTDEKSQSQQSLVMEREREAAREPALDISAPWFIFVRSNIEMEDWYLAVLHASDHPANRPTLDPLQSIFDPSDMARLVETLDEQPDVIPMRWMNALLGRVFFSYYRTHVLEEYIITRLMKKLSKVKRPNFLSDVVVTEVCVGNTPPVFSKPMLKELTKEGDASMEVHLNFKGEIRITVQAVATINLGARFKSYSVKLVLAVVLRELEGNLLVRVKRPPSNRIWYSFTQPPRMVLDVEPVVSDRHITWNMVLSSIESRIKEIILESVVMPNMDDVAFFQSTDYVHRGGIWPDAVRREKQTTPHSGTTRPAPPQEIGDPSRVISLPPETTTDNLVTPSVKGPPLGRAHSTGELQREELLSNDDATAPQATTTAIPDAPPTSSTAVKRRSWFSSVLREGSGSDSDEIPDNVSRGRTNENDSITTHSSGSASSHSDLPDHPDDKYLPSRRPSRPPLPPRVPSGKDVSEGSSSIPSKSSQSPRTNTATPNSPPTSFFSTLKARASDKQALSNSAKEAMKKWSANWNAMRRDASDDSPDAAGAHDRKASDGSTQNQRASYVNVRRKADERQRTVSVNEVGRPQPIDPNVNEIAISYTPREYRRGSRSASLSGSHVENSSSPAESSVPASSDAQEGSASTEVPVAPDDPLREVETTSAPIYTQPPQARTMTIPGIHASHRGEVMSMGYVAASTPAPESKPKTPAIQSVYRLWKNPASSSEQSQEQELEPFVRAKESESAPGPNPLPRMVPPPLPPRSVSSTVTRPTETGGSSSVSSDRSASAALESIVTDDESRRVSVEQQRRMEDVLPSSS